MRRKNDEMIGCLTGHSVGQERPEECAECSRGGTVATRPSSEGEANLAEGTWMAR